ncbi:hypothetical protein ACFO1B_32180 [Dactylosporangium siamense]|uniref:Uncharacterized protein n=1 Tax=Dactylosporangium siamense TaxID=685454 RepID=A0A919PJV1_9ACTN|nr:hypothetical protein [Dactylosporangium siamense]GIG46096.1 hypothetical protein Dsi01nite_041370 [Dactylosporangium siamense]
MSLRDDRHDGPLTGFGLGSLPFEVAKSRMIWTPWHGVMFGLIGLGGICIGVACLMPLLAVGSAVMVILSAIWNISTIGGYRATRRLDKRARAAEVARGTAQTPFDTA